ncbi:hypothetical protein [Rathayibacter soli]|uniref:hypothetical protein n=1 Tax=Rathayibacter soli TaxID=3144168 RepID=UPI0027E42B1C|nr:hypothetical protein [Glaciibacter superstes]
MSRAPRTGNRGRGGVLVAVCLLVGLSGIGATPAPASVPTGLCIPLLLPCPSPAPSQTAQPSPSAPASPRLPNLPGLPGSGLVSPTPTLPAATPGESGTAATSGAPAVPDTSAPTFTLPAAQLTGSSISFAGLHSVSFVTVPLANGSRTPVLKLTADDIVIKDFHLNVRKATGPALISDAGTMELRGNVQVYVDSVTATLLNGKPFTLGAATPPPDTVVPASLLRVNLGLVGVTAGSISLIPSNQVLTSGG